jgi:hypothetical protein
MNNLLITLRIYLIFVAASGFIFGQIFLIILHGVQPLRECLAWLADFWAASLHAKHCCDQK